MLSLSLIIGLSYLLGSIPTSIIVSKIQKGIDIRDYGSKNAGATNVYRVLGPVPALIVLASDAAKGVIAVLCISQLFFGDSYSNLILVRILAGIFAIVGHIYPVYAGFKGGKGIGTGLGVLLALIPREVIMALGLFLIVVTVTRYVSLGSLAAATFIFLALVVEKYYLGVRVDQELVIACLFLTVLVFYTHRSNIKRLLSGTESKFGQKDKENL
jgi:glycerol-3-phosphate acyltransferase PlsY